MLESTGWECPQGITLLMHLLCYFVPVRFPCILSINLELVMPTCYVQIISHFSSLSSYSTKNTVSFVILILNCILQLQLVPQTDHNLPQLLFLASQLFLWPQLILHRDYSPSSFKKPVTQCLYIHMQSACYFCPLQVKVRMYRQFVASVTLLHVGRWKDRHCESSSNFCSCFVNTTTN